VKGVPVHNLESHAGWGGDCAYSPDGSRIVSSARGNSLFIWNAVTGKIEAEMSEQEMAWVTGCEYSPDGRSIASSSLDGMLRIWDAKAHLLNARSKVGSGPLSGCAWSPDGGSIASVSGPPFSMLSSSRNAERRDPNPGRLKLWMMGIRNDMRLWKAMLFGSRLNRGEFERRLEVWAVAFAGNGPKCRNPRWGSNFRARTVGDRSG
jgi:WD40 repeat protein